MSPGSIRPNGTSSGHNMPHEIEYYLEGGVGQMIHYVEHLLEVR